MLTTFSIPLSSVSTMQVKDLFSLPNETLEKMSKEALILSKWLSGVIALKEEAEDEIKVNRFIDFKNLNTK